LGAGEFAARLRTICAELDLTATDAQLASLEHYLALLRRWNSVYNLTAVREPEQMLTQHLADCLAAVGPLQRRLEKPDATPERTSAPRLLDVGSGAGLPGVVLALMLPPLDVVCVDAVGKKTAFIQQAAAELRLRNLTAVHARVENLQLPPFDIITSRAFASLADFVAAAQHLLMPGGPFMAMKGKRHDVETERLPPGWLFHVEPITVPGLDAERCLVWLQKEPGSASVPAPAGA
jgi:16S rRNA (guanine527-N7)-methyltransferase